VARITWAKGEAWHLSAVELDSKRVNACGIIVCAAFAALKAFSVRVQGEHDGTS